MRETLEYLCCPPVTCTQCTVHSFPQGNWGHASCTHCAFFNHMHRWFVQPWLIEATLVSPKQHYWSRALTVCCIKFNSKTIKCYACMYFLFFGFWGFFWGGGVFSRLNIFSHYLYPYLFTYCYIALRTWLFSTVIRTRIPSDVMILMSWCHANNVYIYVGIWHSLFRLPHIYTLFPYVPQNCIKFP